MFWVQVYNPQAKTHERFSLGVPWQDKPTRRTQKLITDAIKAIEEKQFARKVGKARKKSVSLETLLDNLNSDANIVRGFQQGDLSPQTIARRANSLRLILAFDEHATIRSINSIAWAKAFKVYLEKKKNRFGKPLTAWTKNTVFADLKLLTKYAEEQGYIPRDELKKIVIGKIKSRVVHTPIEDEFAYLRRMFHRDRRVFEQIVYMRLVGVRASDTYDVRISRIDFANKRFEPPNVKGRRYEYFPITDALDILFKNLTGHHGDLAFHYENYTSLYRQAHEVEGFIGLHQYKRNYTRELEEEEMLPHIFKMLIHHSSGGAELSYTGKNLNYMRNVLDRAQKPWVRFLSGLYQTKKAEVKV